jgi:hypothetical protein
LCFGFSFSNGEVHLWDFAEGEECTFKASSQAITLLDSEGSIPSYVFSVAASPYYAAGYYSSGECCPILNSNQVQCIPLALFLQINNILVAQIIRHTGIISSSSSIVNIT